MLSVKLTGKSTKFRSIFPLSVDSSAPTIQSAELIKEVTEFPLEAQYRVETDDDSYCRYDVSEDPDSLITDFDNMQDVSTTECPEIQQGELCFSQNSIVVARNLADDKEYSIAFVCQNKAGLTSPSRVFEFETNLESDDSIVIPFP